MTPLVLAVLIAAIVLFLVAAAGMPAGRWGLGWLGAATAVLALVVERWPA